MDFRIVGWGKVVNMRGDPWCGRPTRYARRVSHKWFASLSCCLLTLKHVRTCASPYTAQCGTWMALTLPPHDNNMSGHVLHLPCVQKPAGGGFLSSFNAIHASSTSLAYKSEPEVVLWHFDSVYTSSISLAYKRERRWTFITICTSSTSLACKSKHSIWDCITHLFLTDCRATSPQNIKKLLPHYRQASAKESCGSSLKSVIFAIGWKGEAQADLEQAKTHKHQHQTNTNLKNTNHMF